MKSQNNAWFQVVPTTYRTAEVLARRHGYGTVTNLAKSLPLHAKVLDVGAGASTLGAEIARLRPDIHWTNLDFSYHDKQILQYVSRDVPANLKFIAGDAAKLDEYIKPASLDAVFSYWLFPHLASYDQRTALAAALQLYKAETRRPFDYWPFQATYASSSHSVEQIMASRKKQRLDGRHL